MPEPTLTPLQRLALAFYAFFAVLFRAEVALAIARVREQARSGALPPAGPARGAEPAWTAPPPASHATVVTAPARDAAATAAPPAPSARRDAAPVAPEAFTAREAPAAKEAPAPKEPAAKPAPAAAVPAPPPRAEEPRPDARADGKADPRGAALQVLAALQREGRLVDFVEEDLTGFSDASIGAAARTVHAGCRKVIQELFRLEPVYREAEGATVTVGAGFDPAAIRLVGNVVGKPPFKGALRHHGWRAREVKLPAVTAEAKDPAIVAPAEVEL